MAEACGAVSGQTGTVEVWRYACPRLTLFAPSRSRARRKFPDGNFRRPLVGSGPPSDLQKWLRGDATRRRSSASSSPRSIRSQRESAMDRRTTRCGLSPFARRPHPHASAATIRSFVPDFEPSRDVPGWKRSQDSGFWFCLRPGSHALFSQQAANAARPALASTRGPCGAGGRAFRGLTRSATEMERGEEEATTGRRNASHDQPISAGIKARRLPTSDRRKFPSGNFRSARDLEGAERVNPRKARTPTLQLRPLLLANRGMSPLIAGVHLVGDGAELDLRERQVELAFGLERPAPR